ncbi:MAG: carbohydrate binding domain-containing protein [Gorillibacterium sp.]|nr:carbohydrate binding domain-containing protein [Gorillibacterium sp.]
MNLMLKKVFMFSLLIVFIITATPSTSYAANFSWSFGNDVTASSFNYLDVDPGILRDGSDLWVVYTGGGGGDGRIFRFKGTNMDNLTAQPDGLLDSSFTKPNGDDKYWLGAMWRDPLDGKWYAVAHLEFKYEGKPYFTHYRRLGLATSTDKGANWHYQGDILTSDNPYIKTEFDGNFYDFGEGDHKLYVDTAGGYFYLYYQAAWVDKRDGNRYGSMRVARSPISAKMAPGSWKRWYKGSWNENGLGGHDGDVFNYADSSVVFYSTYLNKFVAIINRFDGSAAISTATNLSTQNWSAQEKFHDPVNGTNRLKWYNVPVDVNGERQQLGQTFRLYSSQSYSGNVNTKYMNITFGSGTVTPVTFANTYSPECVNDYNSGWCKVINYGFEEGNLSGWAGSGGASVISSQHRKGVYSLQLGASNSSAEQVVTNLKPNATYKLRGYMKTASGETVYIGVKNYGGAEVSQSISNTTFTRAEVTFTTGASNTNATIYYYKSTGSSSAFADDMGVDEYSSVIKDDSDGAIVYSGVWDTTIWNPGYYNNTVHYTTATGATAQLSFSGSSIQWYGVKGNGQGKADVYIDGILDATVDLYQATRTNTVCYTKTGLAAGNHTIRIITRSDKNPLSTDKYVEVDYFRY